MANRILTYEFVTEISQQYSSRFEFQKGDRSAYNKALKKGWIDSYSWLGVPKKHKKDSLMRIHVVYAYLDEDNRVAYIGRTNNLKLRHSQHNRKIRKTGNYDVVKKYFMSIGILDKLPLPKILETDLTLVESQEKEDYYINEYKKEGWRVLNTGKTGANVSSTGSFVVKWDYEACRQHALLCKSRKEFEKKFLGAYRVSKAKGWLDEWLPVSPTYHEAEYNWTKELCIEKALEYDSFKEFRIHEPLAYKAALRRGWIKYLTWLKREKRENISKDEIITIARNYKYASDFKKNHPTYYACARKMGIIKELGFVVKDMRKWTYDTCRSEALKYSSQIEFRRGCPVAYDVSLKNGWINDWLPRTIIIRSDEELLSEASAFQTINDLRKSNSSLYRLILTRGLLERTGLKYSRKQWTDEAVREEAAQYETRYAFQKGCKGAYNYAYKHKLLDELFPINSK